MTSSAFYLVGITVGPAMMVIAVTWMCCKLVVETLEHSAEQQSDWMNEIRDMRMHQQHLIDLLSKANEATTISVPQSAFQQHLTDILSKAQSQPSPLTPAETQAPSVPTSGSASASSAIAEAGVSSSSQNQTKETK